MIPALGGLGYRLARFLSRTDDEHESVATCTRESLEATLQAGDVLLIDGTSRISMAINILRSPLGRMPLFASEEMLRRTGMTVLNLSLSKPMWQKVYG